MPALPIRNLALIAFGVFSLGACASWWQQSDDKGGADKATSRNSPSSSSSDPGMSNYRIAPNESDTAMKQANGQDTAPASSSATMQPGTPDSEMKAVLDALVALGAKPVEQLTPEQARSQPSFADALARVKQQSKPDAAIDNAVTTQNLTYPTDGTMQKARIYKPADAGDGPLPVVVYFHGGGWVIADLDVYDATPRAISEAVGAIVVSVGYRKAPEHKFPAAHNDANAAYEWVLQNAEKWGGDLGRIAVAGESAGGNLAANVAIAARDNGWTEPKHMLLVYPVAQANMNTRSYVQYTDAAPLSKAAMSWFVKHTFSDPEQAKDPRISLVAADLKGLPPATLVLAQIDPLQDDGRMLADKLKDSDVGAELRMYEGATHEFFGMADVNSDAKAAQTWAFDRLKADLSRQASR